VAKLNHPTIGLYISSNTFRQIFI